jgi:putative nucleotidyltransferase with HDIG domain
MAPLLGTILVDGTVGMAIGIWNASVFAVLGGGSFVLLLTGLTAAVVGASVADGVRTRSRVLRAGLTIGVCELTCVLAVTAMEWSNPELAFVLLHRAGACLISGFLSAVIVLLILPGFEMMFNITTNISLLELSDLGSPLLQRLAIEAPGTYHHSLVVANLAQAAADEIGANSLLARVCSYYHDIGKLTKPEFFYENLRSGANPHDDLPPSMSALVITSHVKEGVSLAMVHKLPDPVMRTIREHHGTSVLSYFHHKARVQLSDEEGASGESRPNGQNKQVDDSDFRYPGPRPSSKEAAIICLADAVEAASRTLEKTTPGHLEGLVNEITIHRLQDGQLDACSLTLAELTRVKSSFVFTLTNMLHARIPYPKNENRDKQQAKDSPSRKAEAKSAGRPSDAAGQGARTSATVG